MPSAPAASDNKAMILTPAAPKTPRINGPKIFGARSNAPFLYTVPATGDRPMTFSAESLPDGLKIDATTGRITGSLGKTGEYAVILHAKNALGSDERALKIVIGDKIALTPPMGWNSWNCWAGAVDQEKVLKSAHAIVSSGLAQHGWTYVNIDDTWQGRRSGPSLALQANEKFPDIKGLCDEIHTMGLKAGIYSTPWTTSYAKFNGGSADTADGKWEAPVEKPRYNHGIPPFAVAKYSFAKQDAQQWATWGFDYLKYDWNPIDIPAVEEMTNALRATGRDIVYSLSNGANFAWASDYVRLANCWRTTGDIVDTWQSLSSIGFSQDKWAPYAAPGHWNDPDMLIVGWVGWGPKLHPTRLTPDEQYTHISLWCMLSAPLLLGCDLDRLDDFTLSLLTNDEVLALDQDTLGKQAVRAATSGAVDEFVKPLEDGSIALGLFNRGSTEEKVNVRLGGLGLSGKQVVRDLWRQKNLVLPEGRFDITVAPHGVVLLKLTPAK